MKDAVLFKLVCGMATCSFAWVMLENCNSGAQVEGGSGNVGGSGGRTGGPAFKLDGSIMIAGGLGGAGTTGTGPPTARSLLDLDRRGEVGC